MKTVFYLSVILLFAMWGISESKQQSISPGISRPTIVYTYDDPNDTTKNFYVTIFPQGQIKGALVLLPGFGESPTGSLVETDIYKYASESGYITFIPALGDWSFFYCDDASHQRLNRFIDTVFTKHNLSTKHFFIGGYSLGGVAAFQYAEQACQPNSKLRRPAGVFGIDPPLDLERLYISMTTADRPKKNPISQKEDTYFANLFQEKFKTNPGANPKYFWNVSPFSRSDTSHSAIKPLVHVPLRIYNDPDINWYIDNRQVDYMDMNVFDAAAMINWLKSMGNDRAELINCLGKGRRVGKNMRHPHSWSIVDGKELIDWMGKY
jgi:pimeloyl-ACP methyl ester carboxylesterase